MFSQKEIIVRLGKRSIGLPLESASRDARFSIVNETLKPKASIPKQKCRQLDKTLFVHQGRGHLFLDDKRISIRPGQTVLIAANTWHAVQNKGPKYLSLVWTYVPGGVEQYYQGLAELGESPDAEAVKALAERFGIEIMPEEPLKISKPKSTTESNEEVSVMPEIDAAKTPEVEEAKTDVATEAPPKKKPRPRRRTPKVQEGEAKSSDESKPAQARKSRSRGRSEGRTKEVYMDGRWVKVSGDGPVINMGKERKYSRRQNRKS